jgi:hypothetical protein
MANTISLPPDVYGLLRERAQQEQTSPDALAELAVRRYLSTSEQDWHASFEALLAKVQSRTVAFTSGDIESDITAAAQEVKELRRDDDIKRDQELITQMQANGVTVLSVQKFLEQLESGLL